MRQPPYRQYLSIKTQARTDTFAVIAQIEIVSIAAMERPQKLNKRRFLVRQLLERFSAQFIPAFPIVTEFP
ncbi:hypothetical protein C7I84_03185 [Mesorhizobium ephedrae]|uniref:Uncharacterized protein n=1 Tax=Kumtagia ephedrae TaxID=2116701 RepID=A0A2P7SSC8_9HYPH|nr:hypothetical protein C7I84_03185 [Mesorhizobium ephedrae]